MALERDQIVAAAVRLLDQVGLDRLTLRRLASELGVQAPALYWHVKNKQELLDEIADALTREIPLRPLDEQESWRDWLAERMRDHRRMLNAHRDAARLFVAVRPGPAVPPTLKVAVESLGRAGFPPREAVRSLFTLGHYVTGFVLEEQARAAHNPEADLNEARRWLADQPDLLVALMESGPPDGDEAFEHGLSMILEGISTRI
ncbi:TetR/AcrR family transcriptional regulator C-terminal domain-containing protein [Nonomuraea dietziae]|uniref:TetR/AcrR family transcriptional regulator C-terminal domain-containing protein n=1 Tax=Nonomuraea dietziae TaxID=65515 RepID=UPI00340BE49D